jgi:lipopolysaccharide export LptBFGC system permease protein LptF
MGWTLFKYVFKDLVKIFLMTSGALAGILSFGGLLRPLTQQGLDASQVGKILTYFTPAMTTYSFPIAALFAATVVYGRLSADNELTACRAGGLSLGPFLGMAFPGLVFGLLVAITQLLFLCYVVPRYTLKVEKVIYSNLAKLIVTRIERTHKIEFGDSEVYAQKAFIPPSDPSHPRQQIVILTGVSIVAYEHHDPNKDDPKLRDDRFKDPHFKKPGQFWLASSATVNIDDRSIRQGDESSGESPVRLLIGLDGANKFPRELTGGMEAGVEVGKFGPLDIGSPIKEDPKFMTVSRLKWLFEHPEKSRKIADVVAGFLRRDQQALYLQHVEFDLNSGERKAVFLPVVRQQGDIGAGPAYSATDERVIVTLSDDVSANVVPARKVEQDGELQVRGVKPDAIRLDYYRPGEPVAHQTSKNLNIRVHPDSLDGIVNVTLELLDRTPQGATRPMSGQYTELIAVSMPDDVRKLSDRRVAYYAQAPGLTRGDKQLLDHETVSLANGLMAESSSRASFAVSCLILVLVGCALGMMFRSGNFLTAFAVSFIPALLCITLIVAGQQTCRAVPWADAMKHNPVKFGVGLIWSGNVMNALIAMSLLFRLQRQ